MSRNQFLGTIDLSITTSLLTNYNVPTKIPNNIKLNRIKCQDDLILIELGSLLTPDECDEIINNIREKQFENMFEKYDIKERNNSRLIVIDDRLARTLWRRLKFSNKITKLIHNTKPLGFNVQGQWKMNGVNSAMRLNKYNQGEYFSPHKDGQYAPNSDQRSLLSLIIYLTDNYEKGETKFYFPKIAPNSNIKGLTIKEEINAYGGLDNGYECITIKPKKGYALLFTHNLIHEAVPPEELQNHLDLPTQRIVLRSDVLVERKEKLLGFAVCSEEEEDYLACLNFFREAQQIELKEQANIIDRLPTETWLHIFKYLHEQDVHHLIFAYPQFQPLKIIWDAQEIKNFEIDPAQPKYIPTIHAQYGSRTLFRFSDAEFFNQHINECCRVAAVYAFFLLGHDPDTEIYTVRYNRNTHEACEVKMEKLLSDVFYNRNSYGSLYHVKQKGENKRGAMVDLNYSVDRTYMMNRHRSQFIGQDFLPRLHLKIDDLPLGSSDSEDEQEIYYLSTCPTYYLSSQKRHAVHDDHEENLVGHFYSNYIGEYHDIEWDSCDNIVFDYCQNVLKQIDEDSGSSLLRMLWAEDYIISTPCTCEINGRDINEVCDLIQVFNHLIFDFDTHRLIVERLSDEPPLLSARNQNIFYDCIEKLQHLVPRENPISYYRVNIEKLAKETQGFHHAGCVCRLESVRDNQFSFLDYTYLKHVHLAIAQNINDVFVFATYGGIATL